MSYRQWANQMNLGQAQVRKTYWVSKYWAACSNTKNQQILLCLFLQLCLRLTLHLFNKRSLQDRIAFSEHKHHPRFHTWARPKFILLAPWRDDLRTFCHMLFLQSSSSSLVCCVCIGNLIRKGKENHFNINEQHRRPIFTSLQQVEFIS